MNAAFAEHVSTIVGPQNYRNDLRERKVYATDIGVMPPLISPLIPAGTPDIVVHPQDKIQLSELIKTARADHVPLVVRGAATSGYGGVLPQKDAMVIDLSGWDKVISIDEENEEVTCQAGAIWEEVDRALNKVGFELCLYPSSYPSSTVAGWLAQGGSGFGSYEYGEFKDNVVSAQVILPTGEIRDFRGDELQELVADAEGITGAITEVTFKVRPLEETAVFLISFPTAQDINEALASISEQRLPFWSVGFFNPTSVKLKKQLPARHCHSYEADDVASQQETEENLPISYLALLALPKSREEGVVAPLKQIAAKHQGTLLSQAEALHEWEERTAPMRLKRIGPSIIPTEAIIPLRELADTLDDIDKKIHQPFVLEGMLSKGDSAVLLGYIPHDERSVFFNVAFALSLSVIKIANQHGGSGYATGLYFRNEASHILGNKKIEGLKRFKHKADPDNLINPGKVFATPGEKGGALNWLMKTAMKLEPVIRPLANIAKPRKRTAPAKRHGIPGDVELMAITCSRCGYCVHTCEQYTGRGWESQSPRGKYIWLQELYKGKAKWDRAAADTFLLCTTCERCDFRCQLELPVEPNGMALRNNIVNEQEMGTFPPFEMMAASLKDEGDIWAGKREHRADWLSDDLAAKLSDHADVLYFAGCTASYVENDIAESTLRLLIDSGHKVAYLGTEESCCGIPMKMAGKWDLFTEVYHHNVQAARALGVTTIVTSCPACALVWKELYAEEAQRLGEPYEFEVKHYSELIAPALADGTLELKENVLAGHRVTFHDSCHVGRAQGIYEPPRDMLKAIPDIDYVEMEHNREEGICCGSVVTLVGELPVAPQLGCSRLQEAVDAGADTVVALCPCCEVQLRDAATKSGLDVRVDDLSRVVANAAGYPIEPSSEYTAYMWSFFERFIVLMQPKEMAQFMVALFPQMLHAMPLHMGKMMKPLAKTNVGAALMTKMMPLLFPKMAPGILAKVMPDMITEVEKRIGSMPEDMEALMPGLLPKTMDSLMSSYIPQLIPYLVPLFVDYLHNDTTPSMKQALTA